MNKLPSICFLVVSYNNPGRLGRCLRSIRQQIYPSNRIIVTDDGSDDMEAVNLLCSQWQATLVSRTHDYKDGRKMRNLPAVMNQATHFIEMYGCDILQTLQQDHILAPDFALWLARCFDPGAITFGLTQHQWEEWTDEEVRSLLRIAHLPDGEVRYENYLRQGRACLIEMDDWRSADGLDMACAGANWMALDSKFHGQDHSWMDWMLRQQMAGHTLLINPLMRLWHTLDAREDDPTEIEESYKYMQEKWGDDIFNSKVMQQRVARRWLSDRLSKFELGERRPDIPGLLP